MKEYMVVAWDDEKYNPPKKHWYGMAPMDNYEMLKNLDQISNELAMEGWRLVTVAADLSGPFAYNERDKPEGGAAE